MFSRQREEPESQEVDYARYFRMLEERVKDSEKRARLEELKRRIEVRIGSLINTYSASAKEKILILRLTHALIGGSSRP